MMIKWNCGKDDAVVTMTRRCGKYDVVIMKKCCKKQKTKTKQCCDNNGAGCRRGLRGQFRPRGLLEPSQQHIYCSTFSVCLSENGNVPNSVVVTSLQQACLASSSSATVDYTTTNPRPPFLPRTDWKRAVTNQLWSCSVTMCVRGWGNEGQGSVRQAGSECLLGVCVDQQLSGWYEFHNKPLAKATSTVFYDYVPVAGRQMPSGHANDQR